MPTKLSVNVNKVALLRNQRDYGIPSVVRAADACIKAGAQGITVHPRPDQRHITPGDVSDLAALLKHHPDIEYNIEGNPFEGAFLDHCAAVQPHQATLVPDSPDQRTSDHGWDIAKDGQRLKPIIEKLQGHGTRVSLFMDPDAEGIKRVSATGAERIELYTESYATAFRSGDYQAVLAQFVEAAESASAQGLGVNAGHDLNAANLSTFAKAIPNLLEVSIGHELTADALFDGWDRTVKAYLAALVV